MLNSEVLSKLSTGDMFSFAFKRFIICDTKGIMSVRLKLKISVTAAQIGLYSLGNIPTGDLVLSLFRGGGGGIIIADIYIYHL